MQRFLESSLRRAGMLVFLCLMMSAAAQGQTTSAASPVSPIRAAPTPPTIRSLALQVDHADEEATRIAAGAHLRGIDDADLQVRLAAIPAVKGEISDALAALEPRLKFADARLAELGPQPGPGQPAEDPEIAQERSKISAARRMIDTEVKQAHLVIGAQNALGVGTTYLGAILAIIMASAYLGLSLDRITLLASALSVGIGFGLQSIVGNFVSGLILLVERPVKVGDWIAIGDLDGDVRKISVRATEIEMADRSKLIVPNTDLVSRTIRNVTRGSTLARLRIVLRVSDDADPILVRDLLKARLKDHPELVHEPAPVVYLTDVRDGALEFAATGYVASARDAYRIKSDLLFQIIPDLRGANIALATSSPVVNVGIGERSIEPREQGRST